MHHPLPWMPNSSFIISAFTWFSGAAYSSALPSPPPPFSPSFPFPLFLLSSFCSIKVLYHYAWDNPDPLAPPLSFKSWASPLKFFCFTGCTDGGRRKMWGEDEGVGMSFSCATAKWGWCSGVCREGNKEMGGMGGELHSSVNDFLAVQRDVKDRLTWDGVVSKLMSWTFHVVKEKEKGEGGEIEQEGRDDDRDGEITGRVKAREDGRGKII